MRRWPNVPAVYGWLSLDARGTWRLHESGDAQAGGAGGAITNERLIAFIERNYEHDAHGNWFFQNGPQRVYVRLDAAPFILRMAAGTGSTLETHTGVAVSTVMRWLVDEQGRLFAHLPAGGAIVSDRDLARLGEQLCNTRGESLMDLLEHRATVDDPLGTGAQELAPTGGGLPFAPLKFVLSRQLPGELGFVANPGTEHSSAV